MQAIHNINLASLLEMFGQMFREPYIVQRYLKEVRKGDKRIILIDDGLQAGHVFHLCDEFAKG